jgi:hypothetical protein
MKRFFTNILTNFVFKFLFEKTYENFKHGDILVVGDDLFEFDDENGNINSLKDYYTKNGFWNYIKIKEGMVYNMTDKRWSNKNCQGYTNGEYYKNGVRKASRAEIELYKAELKKITI